jgi:acyl-CoA reductase-like NAD-dependent aldehyde dehydrogenase
VVTFLTYAAENARRIEGDISPPTTPTRTSGSAACRSAWWWRLTAWNYPAALAARKIGPALVAGNTIVVKGHEATPLSALEIARSPTRSASRGRPQRDHGDGRAVGEALVRSPLSDLVSMTGSVRAGREIYAAGANDLKVLRLELGGKAPSSCWRMPTSTRRGGGGRVALHQLRADLHLQRAHVSPRSHRRHVPRPLRHAGEGATVGDPLTSPDMGPEG